MMNEIRRAIQISDSRRTYKIIRSLFGAACLVWVKTELSCGKRTRHRDSYHDDVPASPSSRETRRVVTLDDGLLLLLCALNLVG